MTQKKIWIAVAVLLSVGFWNYRHKHHNVNRNQEAEGLTETDLRSSSRSKLATAPSNVAANAKLDLRTPTAPVLLADKARKFKPAVTMDEKIRVNLSLLSKTKAFQKLNPKFNLADFKAGRISPSSIIIPKGTAMNAELNPACKGRYAWIDNRKLTLREQQNLNSGLPVFANYQQNQDQSLQQVSDGMAQNPCVLNVGLNDSTSVDPTHLTKEEKIDVVQKLVNDRIVTAEIVKAAVQAGQTPRMAVIGSIDDLKEVDPALLLTNEKGKRLATFAQYSLGPQYQDVNMSRLAFPVRNSHSDSDAAYSNAIIRAANAGTNIINVVHPNFDSANFQAAVALAGKKGAVVVTRVPVRLPAAKQ